MRRLLVAVTMAAVAAAYLILSPYFEKLNNPNENVRVYMALSLAESQTFAINSVAARWGYVNDKAKKGDLLFPGKAPGTSYLAAPSVWLGLKVSAVRGVEATKQAVVSWARLGATTLPLLLFFLLYLRATRWVTDHLPTRLLGLLMLALGSTLLSYGGLAVSHSVAAAASFGGYLAVLAHRREPDRAYLPLVAGLCFGGAVMLEYPGLLGAGVAWLLGFWGSPRRVRYTLLTVAGSLLPIGLLALFHLRAHRFDALRQPGEPHLCGLCLGWLLRPQGAAVQRLHGELLCAGDGPLLVRALDHPGGGHPIARGDLAAAPRTRSARHRHPGGLRHLHLDGAGLARWLGRRASLHCAGGSCAGLVPLACACGAARHPGGRPALGSDGLLGAGGDVCLRSVCCLLSPLPARFAQPGL